MDEPIVVVARGVEFAGHVRSTDGIPIEGASLALTLPGSIVQARDVGGSAVHLLLPLEEARSDTRGRFGFARTGFVEGLELVAEAEGFDALRSALAPRSNERLELVLTPSKDQSTLHGIVVQASGAPAPGALVSLGTTTALRASDGTFALEPERWRTGGWLRAVAPGALPAELDLERWPTSSPTEPIVLTLGPSTLTLAGRVLDAEGAQAVHSGDQRTPSRHELERDPGRVAAAAPRDLQGPSRTKPEPIELGELLTYLEPPATFTIDPCSSQTQRTVAQDLQSRARTTRLGRHPCPRRSEENPSVPWPHFRDDETQSSALQTAGPEGLERTERAARTEFPHERPRSHQQRFAAIARRRPDRWEWRARGGDDAERALARERQGMAEFESVFTSHLAQRTARLGDEYEIRDRAWRASNRRERLGRTDMPGAREGRFCDRIQRISTCKCTSRVDAYASVSARARNDLTRHIPPQAPREPVTTAAEQHRIPGAGRSRSHRERRDGPRTLGARAREWRADRERFARRRERAAEADDRRREEEHLPLHDAAREVHHFDGPTGRGRDREAPVRERREGLAVTNSMRLPAIDLGRRHPLAEQAAHQVEHVDTTCAGPRAAVAWGADGESHLALSAPLHLEPSERRPEMARDVGSRRSQRQRQRPAPRSFAEHTHAPREWSAADVDPGRADGDDARRVRNRTTEGDARAESRAGRRRRVDQLRQRCPRSAAVARAGEGALQQAHPTGPGGDDRPAIGPPTAEAVVAGQDVAPRGADRHELVLEGREGCAEVLGRAEERGVRGRTRWQEV